MKQVGYTMATGVHQRCTPDVHDVTITYKYMINLWGKKKGIRYQQRKYAISNTNTLSAMRIRYPLRKYTPDVHVNAKWTVCSEKSENDLLGHHILCLFLRAPPLLFLSLPFSRHKVDSHAGSGELDSKPDEEAPDTPVVAEPSSAGPLGTSSGDESVKRIRRYIAN